jgi:hypothetical protein
MSHSGLMHRGGIDIDDDWFIYGIDGRICASWGDDDNPQLAHINPGHPGYIEYTKKWIRFYMKECGAKGMFFDCLGWGFPCDFRPRSFMRYPGDTNRMAIKFIEEIAACVKECDPEGILLGEGSTLDAPLDVLSLNMNPARGVDGRGPRDFILALNARSPKRVAIDQGPAFSIPSGMVRALPGPENAERNRLLAGLLKKHGGGAFEHLSGELAILPGERLLVVPHYGKHAMPGKPEFRLPDPWSGIERLTDAISGTQFARNARGLFTDLPGGIYRM